MLKEWVNSWSNGLMKKWMNEYGWWNQLGIKKYKLINDEITRIGR